MVKPLGRVGIYFKLNRILLSLIGLWPYQTPGERRLAMSVLFLFTISQLIPQLAGFFKVKDDFDMVIECLPALGIAVLCLIKVITFTTNNDKMKTLLMGIQKDFDSAMSGPSPEMAIFQRSGERSLKLSKIYATSIYTIATFFALSPLLGALSSPIVSAGINQTESPKRLPYVVEYYVDTNEYFYLIMMHSFFSTFAFVTILIAADSMFTVYLEHGCAKFMVLKYRLSQVIEPRKFDVDINRREIDDLVYRRAKICVHLHKEAIEFADAIESAYSICQLFQVFICCLLMSINGLNAVTKWNQPDELLSCFGVIFSLMLQLLFYSWPSHELMDQSVNVCEAIYDMEWYCASIPTRKLLLQMMTRTSKACKITAGKLYVMSMENFCKILGNSMTYFTVLSSIQEQSTTIVKE